MEPDSMFPSPEQALAAHGTFVRRLARRLLVDAHLADDVAQEAWSRWLAEPPTSANPRGWFARVVRNLAANSLRSRARRANHEELAARPEAARSGAEEAEQAEVLRQLVEAVLALETPQRDTLLALYFRGVDARTLARESGVPEPTVRDRQRRALATLRQRLDKKFGSPAAWGLGLARLAGPLPAPMIPLGVAALAAGLVLTLGVLGGTAWSLIRRTSTGQDPRPSAPASEVVASNNATGAFLRASAFTVSKRSSLAQVPGASSPLTPGASEQRAADSSELVTVRVRFVTSDGSPLANVPFELGLGGPLSRLNVPEPPPPPESWRDIEGMTDDEGRLEVAFTPVPEYYVGLSARSEGRVSFGWGSDSLQAGELVDLGEVVLYRAGALEGRMVDANGAALVGREWRVGAVSIGPPGSEDRLDRMSTATTDPVTGRFRVEGLLPGLCRLDARAPASENARAEIVLAEGEVATLDIPYVGVDPGTRLDFWPEVKTFYNFTPEPDFVRLVDSQGRSRKASASHRSFLFEGLEEGEYSLQVSDPRFEPLRLDGLSGGRVVEAELVGSSALALSVVGFDGAPVDLYAVEVKYAHVKVEPTRFDVHDGRTQLVAGRVPGLVAGDCVVRVRCEQGTAEAPVANLLPGETRFVTLTLTPRSRLRGTLRDEAGLAQAGVELLALRPAAVDDGPKSPVLRRGMTSSQPSRHRLELGSVCTAQDGSFQFDFEREDTILLHAVHALGTHELGEPVALVPQGVTEVERTMAPLGMLTARVVAPAGQSSKGLGVFVVRVDEDAQQSRQRPAVALDDLGQLCLGPVPFCRYRAYLVPPKAVRHQSGPGVAGVHSLRHYVLDGNSPTNSLLLGELEMTGSDEPFEFHPAAFEWPGSIELDVNVNLAAVTSWFVTLSASSLRVELETDPAGHLGPIPIFAGSWSVSVEDPLTGWKFTYPDPLTVRASQATRQVLELERP